MVKRERPEAFLKNFQIRAIIYWPGGCWSDNTMLAGETNWTISIYWMQKNIRVPF